MAAVMLSVPWRDTWLVAVSTKSSEAALSSSCACIDVFLASMQRGGLLSPYLPSISYTRMIQSEL